MLMTALRIETMMKGIIPLTRRMIIGSRIVNVRSTVLSNFSSNISAICSSDDAKNFGFFAERVAC